MERRDWSLKALSELIYIDSLESFEKADALVKWHKNYLTDDSIENFDLELVDLKKLEELFFKNINFLKKHKEETRQELIKIQKMKKFLKN
ncbi:MULTISPECIES: hypothetical protein [Arcobacter]|jgi:hypothetical protein|uniref:Uncharacterized protein n=1 Tax=Arcobacter ellisii TaxID=913109 RepID=A0A347U5C4_9BACT|nr:hypothetical protein [Arcobacter ellisii]AXX94052.1 hypothetical protein AELL_0360 [Arcobacter ellisii]RXI32412.1 hypothetical protein CP962_02075 [Arcobacter ellisii]